MSILLAVGILFLLGAFAGLLILRARRAQELDQSTCGQCGYPVRGLPSFTCPECGSDLREVGIVAPRAGAGHPGNTPSTRRWLWALAIGFGGAPIVYLTQRFAQSSGSALAGVIALLIKLLWIIAFFAAFVFIWRPTRRR